MKVKMLVGMISTGFEAASDQQLAEMLGAAYDHVTALYEVAYPERKR